MPTAVVAERNLQQTSRACEVLQTSNALIGKPQHGVARCSTPDHELDERAHCACVGQRALRQREPPTRWRPSCATFLVRQAPLRDARARLARACGAVRLVGRAASHYTCNEARVGALAVQTDPGGALLPALRCADAAWRHARAARILPAVDVARGLPENRSNLSKSSAVRVVVVVVLRQLENALRRCRAARSAVCSTAMSEEDGLKAQVKAEAALANRSGFARFMPTMTDLKKALPVAGWACAACLAVALAGVCSGIRGGMEARPGRARTRGCFCSCCARCVSFSVRARPRGGPIRVECARALGVVARLPLRTRKGERSRAPWVPHVLTPAARDTLQPVDATKHYLAANINTVRFRAGWLFLRVARVSVCATAFALAGRLCAALRPNCRARAARPVSAWPRAPGRVPAASNSNTTP